MFRLVALSLLASPALVSCDVPSGIAAAQPPAADAQAGRVARTPANVASSASPAYVPPAPIVMRERLMMGTVFKIAIAGSDTPAVRQAIDAAFAEIVRLEELLSEWRADSEISRINAAAGRQPVEVGADALAVVRAGLQVSRWSNGAFDLSWAALRGLYRFDVEQPQTPSLVALRRQRRLINWQDIVVDPQHGTVFLKRKGMAIGTGGIAKGYALDRVGEMLVRAGFGNYMLFAGGQVQVHGRRGDRPWRVGIQHPRRDDYFAFLEVTDGSISTSGDYEHFFLDRRGHRWHHIVDPKTGLPVPHMISVTVHAETGIYADALSTAVFVLGVEKARRMLARIPERATAVMVDSRQRLHFAPLRPPHLVSRQPLRDGDPLP